MSTKNLLESHIIDAATPALRLVAHPIRLRILDYLETYGASYVSQLVAVCQAEQAVVSQQLRILKDQGVVTCRRDGNFVFYELTDGTILNLLGCIRSHACNWNQRSA